VPGLRTRKPERFHPCLATEQENPTMTTATTKAAANGSQLTAPDPAPERLTGMALVEQAQAYHLASIARDAAYEAERLCDDIYRAASAAYLRHGTDRDAAQATTEPEMRDKASEAVRCLVAAENYLRSLTAGEPPF